MGTLRRTVEGWMGNLLYQKLGDEPRTEVAWKLLRDLVGQQLFGTEFVAVPFIESALYYNQLFVFVKKQSILSRLGFRPSAYKVVGNLDYLVNRDVSTWTPQFDFSPWDIADSHSMYREYKLRIMSNQEGVEKSIDFKVVEAHARSAHPPTPGTTAIHRNLLQELSGVKTLYVITDVVLASYVKLTVRIGNRHMVFVYDRDMPIGFKYRKYRLRNDGTFVSQLDTTLKYFDKEVTWLLPNPQPIPSVPLWDHMRRRYHNGGRRKMRHNLTIPTPSEVPDVVIGRALAQGGVLRLERPLLNAPVLRARDVIDMDNNEEEERNYWQNQRFQRVNYENERRVNRRSVSMETFRGSD